MRSLLSTTIETVPLDTKPSKVATMVDIDVSTTFILQTESLGWSSALASTPENASVILEPVTGHDSQQWFATKTNSQGYYWLHTVGKGDDFALGVTNYQIIDLQFFATQETTGQFWRLDSQEDGSLRISNMFTPSGVYISIENKTQRPILSTENSEGSRWTSSTYGLQSTSVTAASIASTQSAPPTSPASSETPSLTGEPSSTAVPTDDNSGDSSGTRRLSTGGIAGVCVAAAIVAVALGYLIYRKVHTRKGGRLPPQADEANFSQSETEQTAPAASQSLGVTNVLHG